MAEQWEEEQHLEEIVERRRRMEGSSLKLGVIQKVPELVVNERMSQGERVKNPKVMKVPGWSIEAMKVDCVTSKKRLPHTRVEETPEPRRGET